MHRKRTGESTMFSMVRSCQFLIQKPKAVTYHLKVIRCGKVPVANPEVPKLPAMPTPLNTGSWSSKWAGGETCCPLWPTATIRAKAFLLPQSYSHIRAFPPAPSPLHQLAVEAPHAGTSSPPAV